MSFFFRERESATNCAIFASNSLYITLNTKEYERINWMLWIEL